MAMTPQRRPRDHGGIRMPACRYGAHCRLPHCIYRHEESSTPQMPAVCINFLTGSCAFGDDCWNWHPATTAERQAILGVLSRRDCTNPRPCPFGARCLFRCRDAEKEDPR